MDRLSLLLMSASVEAPLFVNYFNLLDPNVTPVSDVPRPLSDSKSRALSSGLIEIESRLYPIEVQVYMYI